MQSSSQIITINKPTPSFLQARCPSCNPTNSVRALTGIVDVLSHVQIYPPFRLTMFGQPTKFSRLTHNVKGICRTLITSHPLLKSQFPAAEHGSLLVKKVSSFLQEQSHISKHGCKISLGSNWPRLGQSGAKQKRFPVHDYS